MNSSTKASAFSFETEFSESGQILNEGGQSYKRYRQEEVDAMCAEANRAGLNSVEADAERRIAASAEAIVQHLAPLLPFAVNFADQMRREAGELALLMARKLAGAALSEFSKEAIEESLSETLSNLPTGLKLVLSVSPDVIERLEPAIMSRLPRDTEMTVQADPKAPAGSWRLTWDSGSFSHDPDVISGQLESLLENHLNQPIDPQGDLFASVA